MKIIGLTGGIGAGKTQILEYLNDKYGATICQADQVAKRLQKKGTEVYQKIVEHFGEEILDEKEEIDREKLGSIVFADSKELEVLNGIVHPAVKEEVLRKISSETKRSTNLFLLEAALLIEDHYDEICDELWYVYVQKEVRKKRLIYSRGYQPEKVEEIMASQLSKEDFFKACDRVIDNNGVFAETMLQLDKIVSEL